MTRQTTALAAGWDAAEWASTERSAPGRDVNEVESLAVGGNTAAGRLNYRWPRR